MHNSRMAEESDMNHNMMGDSGFEEEDVPPSLPVKIDEDKKNELVQQAERMKQFFEIFDQEFNRPENEYFCVISASWLRKWKKYTSYDNIARNDEPDPKWFGQVHPGKINEDIIKDPQRAAKYPDDDDFRNVFLKDEIQEKRDYELVTEAAWDFLAQGYENTLIKRPAYTLSNGMRAVEVALKQILLVPINNNFLKEMDHKRAQEFRVYVIQASAHISLDNFKSDLVKVCKTRSNKQWFETSTSYYNSYFEATEETLRLWKLDPAISLKAYFQQIAEACSNSRTYDYQIEFKGQYLEKDRSVKLEEAQVATEDYVFIEVRESHKGWNFYGDGAPILAKCEFCNKYGELPVQCACKKVAYCSEDCKGSDKRFHRSRCDKAGEDEEEESKSLVQKPNSKNGLVGLQNLGNTCFMNSGLQCLSNVIELTRYFLTDKFLAEINETNPLGTKGKLVKKYATFLKHLWFGTAGVYSPWALKMAISEFQPMFSGYQQHDSQELLAFLIDGIHEDLNRVKNKPFTETIESEDQTDHYGVAMRSWENHLKRNQSVIVDLFHGQFKSQITCPTCSRISITFDPFNSVSLPIPIKKEKEIDFFFIHANNKSKAVKLSFTYQKATHTVSQLKEQTAKLLGKNPKNFYFVFATYHSKDVVADEDKMLTNELRKKKKYKNLFAIEMAEEDLNADPEDRVDVDLHTTKKTKSYYGSEIHKPQSFIRTISLRKSYTLKQVYIKIFRYYRFLFDESWPEDEKEEWLKLSDEEAFDKFWEQPERKPFYIHIVTNFSSSQICYFCGERRCDNCKLKYDDATKLSDLLSKIKDPEYNFELEMVFDDLPAAISLEALNNFTDLTKNKTGTSDGEEKEKGISIYDSFNQFELPEQLGEENAWYCSKCKAHQRATKKMEIYKAPPILILHFKRFKSGTSFYKKGKITEKVDFPIDDLDLQNFVINPELPTDYPVERILPNLNTEAAAADPNAEPFSTQNEPMNVEETKDTDSPSKKMLKTQEKMTVEENGENLHYSLFAVVNHYGNLGFGHYTAYAKNAVDNSWHYFDDSRVSDESPGSVCTPAAYVLFYKRKGWEFKI